MTRQKTRNGESMRDLTPEELQLVQGGQSESLARKDARPEYDAIVFVGGWGSSSYQYAYEGSYS